MAALQRVGGSRKLLAQQPWRPAARSAGRDAMPPPCHCRWRRRAAAAAPAGSAAAGAPPPPLPHRCRRSSACVMCLPSLLQPLLDVTALAPIPAGVPRRRLHPCGARRASRRAAGGSSGGAAWRRRPRLRKICGSSPIASSGTMPSGGLLAAEGWLTVGNGAELGPSVPYAAILPSPANEHQHPQQQDALGTYAFAHMSLSTRRCAADQPDWNPARFVRSTQLAPGVRCAPTAAAGLAWSFVHFWCGLHLCSPFVYLSRT